MSSILKARAMASPGSNSTSASWSSTTCDIAVGDSPAEWVSRNGDLISSAADHLLVLLQLVCCFATLLFAGGCGDWESTVFMSSRYITVIFSNFAWGRYLLVPLCVWTRRIGSIDEDTIKALDSRWLHFEFLKKYANVWRRARLQLRRVYEGLLLLQIVTQNTTSNLSHHFQF